MPSSYDDLPQTRAELRSTFALVRLQIVSPLSLLVSIGANVIRIRSMNYELNPPIDPGMPTADVSRIHPTLVSPLTWFISGYWIVLYALQIGLCLILVLTRNENTKDTLLHGVGIRFSIANWLMAGWAVFWTMQFTWSFYAAEVLVLLNVVNLFSIYFTLMRHYHDRHVLDWIFIHAPMRMMLVILFSVDWLDNGFIALGWESRDPAHYDRYSFQACAAIAAVNLVGLLIVYFARDLVWAASAFYLLISLLLKRPKPTTVVGTIIIFLVLYPAVYLLSLALHRVKTREGRIALEREAREGDIEGIVVNHHDAEAQRAAAEGVAVPAKLPAVAPPADGAAAA